MSVWVDVKEGREEMLQENNDEEKKITRKSRAKRKGLR